MLPADAKNIERLKHLQIENLWINGAKEKDFEKIFALVQPKYLNLYNVSAKDLQVLNSLIATEVIVLEWNTNAERLWDITKNSSLKNLEIRDFSKLNNLEDIATATQITELTISAVKIKSLEPIKSLTRLKHLSLTNLKIEDDSLKSIANLKNLVSLNLSNQFNVEEYAWLAVKLKNTDCKMFNAVNDCRIKDANEKVIYDSMVTGKKSIFLLSTVDHVKIEKYKSDFEILKNKFENENGNIQQ